MNMHYYKKLLVATAGIFTLMVSTGGISINKVNAITSPNGATGGGSLPTVINLNDTSDTNIRSYYSTLTSLSDSEKRGNNLLKNLKPILQNMYYYSYDSCWKMYEITDRDWNLSPASGDTVSTTYNSSSNTYTKYTYGTSNSSGGNNPYVRTLYRNRDENGSIISSGRIKEWGDHSTTGTNREHVWCQSRGFKDESGASGPAGTDIHHRMSGDAYVNQTPHNNNPYGNVDISKTYSDAGSKYVYYSGNLFGYSSFNSSSTTKVFEPQDWDKGDIARACFYMVACYNNLAG